MGNVRKRIMEILEKEKVEILQRIKKSTTGRTYKQGGENRESIVEYYRKWIEEIDEIIKKING